MRVLLEKQLERLFAGAVHWGGGAWCWASEGLDFFVVGSGVCDRWQRGGSSYRQEDEEEEEEVEERSRSSAFPQRLRLP